MADDLQTRHGRRLLHSYFMQWTEKTRQMQRAKELHNQTILKRLDLILTCLCLVRSSLNPRNTILLRFWSVYGEVTTHLPLNFAHALLCPGRINVIPHTKPQEFENGGFTLKTHSVFSVHITPQTFEDSTISGQSKTCAGKYHDYLDLYNNQINACALIGQSAMGYCAGKPTEKSRVFWIII